MSEEQNQNQNHNQPNEESVAKTGSYSARRKENGLGSLKEAGNALRGTHQGLMNRKEKASSRDGSKKSSSPSPFGNVGGHLRDQAVNKAKSMANGNPIAKNLMNHLDPSSKKDYTPLKKNANPLIPNSTSSEHTDGTEETEEETTSTRQSKTLHQKRSRPDFLGLRNRIQGNHNDSQTQMFSASAQAFFKKALPFLLPIFAVTILIFLFLAVLTSTINNFGPLMGINAKLGDDIEEGYEANDKEEEEFYERVKVVADEYNEKGIKIEAELVGGVYFILQSYNPNLSMDDFDDRMIRRIVKAMFDKDAEDEEDLIYDKDTFVSNLIDDVFPKLIPKIDSDLYPTIADEIFEYIDDYKDLIGAEEEDTNEGEGNGVLFAKGNPTSTRITSEFDGRTDPITGKLSTHKGMDLVGANHAYGAENVIAALDGEVVYPSSTASAICPSGSNMSCGGGYGNYIVIQHADGNYTLYAHLHKGSVFVKAGDQVKQGQVIAKMGSSGRSTGTHLHFEVRVGSNVSSAVTDPRNYIDPDNPRPVSSGTSGDFSKEFISFLHSWEGVGKYKPVGGNYIVYDDGGGTLTVGYGVAIPYNLENFSKFGINGRSLKVGSKVPISIVDQIEQIEIMKDYKSIQKMIAKEGIKDLKVYQVEALLSRFYNVGNVNSFPSKYKKYGNTQKLYDNYMARPITSKGKVMRGLIRRREAEWKLFHEGKYVNN